jgi:hypothetical protein
MRKRCVKRVYAELKRGPLALPAIPHKLVLRNVYACLRKVYAISTQSLRIPINERKPCVNSAVFRGLRMFTQSLRMVYAKFTHFNQ